MRTRSGGSGGPSWISKTPTPRAREPIRNKARFNSALAEALRDVERRDDGFVPPAVHPRGRAGRHGRDDPKPTSKDDARPQPVLNNARDDAEKEGFDKEPNEKEKRRRLCGGGAARRNRRGRAEVRAAGRVKPPGSFLHHQLEEALASLAAARPRTRRSRSKATAASALVAEATLAARRKRPRRGRARRDARRRRRRRRGGRGGPNQDGGVRVPPAARNLTRNRCVCGSRRSVLGTYPVGAMLALQGAGSVGTDIEIYWPLDEVHYVARVTSYDPAELQHMVTYEADGVREFLCLWKEDVKVLDGTEERHAKSGADAPLRAARRARRRRRAAEAPAAASAAAAGARPRGWTPPPSRARTPTRRCLWAYSF